MILNENDNLGRFIVRLLAQSINTYRCLAGISKFSVEANGDIFPCDSFVGNSEYCMGNIYENLSNEKVKLFKKNSIYDKKCSECWIRYLCAGDCPHNCYAVNGSIEKSDMYFCIVNKKLVEFAIDLLYFIKSNYEAEYLYIEKMCKIKTRKGNR